MKIQLILCLLTGLLALEVHSLNAQEAEGSRLEVTVSGLKNNKGQVGILLFDHKEGFPSDWEAAVGEVMLPIENGEVRHTFTGLSSGEYAVAVMHDENGNDKLDVNFFGIPKEGNGVSNNVRNLMGPPKFEQAAFKIDRPSHSVTVKIEY